MNARLGRRVTLPPLAAVLLAGLWLPSCGGSTTSPSSTQGTVLLDTTVTVVLGVTCNTGGVSTDFNGTAGKTVTIAATGAASLTPRFTLYAPDFTTQLGGSSSSGAGASSLTSALTLTGVHHVSVCDVNGVAGSIRLVVTQR
jgi:hypothetical protein